MTTVEFQEIPNFFRKTKPIINLGLIVHLANKHNAELLKHYSHKVSGNKLIIFTILSEPLEDNSYKATYNISIDGYDDYDDDEENRIDDVYQAVKTFKGLIDKHNEYDCTIQITVTY